MAGSNFGTLFTLTSFGESHGIALGGVIDGMPANIEIDFDAIQSELDRRRPGQSDLVSPRKEKDVVEFLSGFFDGKSTGTPIGFIIKNDDQQSYCLIRFLVTKEIGLKYCLHLKLLPF